MFNGGNRNSGGTFDGGTRYVVTKDDLDTSGVLFQLVQDVQDAIDIGNVNTSVAALEVQVASLDNAIDTALGLTTGLREDLTNLQVDVGNFALTQQSNSDSIAAFPSTYVSQGAFNNAISDIAGTFGALGGTYVTQTTHNGDISGLQSTIAGLGTVYVGQSTYTSGISNLQQQITALGTSEVTQQDLTDLENANNIRNNAQDSTLDQLQQQITSNLSNSQFITGGLDTRLDLIELETVPQVPVNAAAIALNGQAITALQQANMSLGGWFSSHSLFTGQPTEIARNFYNHSAATLEDTELVSWVLLKGLINAIFPIGCLQLSKNGTVPSSFGGYITWTLVSEADGRYLRCYGGGASGGYAPTTQAVGSLMTHNHSIAPIVIPTQTVTTGNNTTFTATSTVTDGTFGSNWRAMSTSAGNGPSGLSTLTFTAHTHQVVIPTQNATGGTIGSTGATAKNECASYSVLIYTRTA